MTPRWPSFSIENTGLSLTSPARSWTEGLRLHIFKGLDAFVSRYFTDHRAKKILEYAMVFLGTGPAEAPAFYSIMSHVDLESRCHLSRRRHGHFDTIFKQPDWPMTPVFTFPV